MKKEVLICDVCKDRVATQTCSICGNDMCNYCGKNWRVIKRECEIEIRYCKNCLNKKISNEVLKEIKKMIIEQMKRGHMLENLSNENVNKS